MEEGDIALTIAGGVNFSCNIASNNQKGENDTTLNIAGGVNSLCNIVPTAWGVGGEVDVTPNIAGNVHRPCDTVCNIQVGRALYCA